VVTASFGAARIWDADSGHEIAVLQGRIGPLNIILAQSAEFSPDGTRVVTASLDGARIWDANSGREIAVLTSRIARLTSVGFSPDGTRLPADELDVDDASKDMSESGLRIRAVHFCRDDRPSRQPAKSHLLVVTPSRPTLVAQHIDLHSHRDLKAGLKVKSSGRSSNCTRRPPPGAYLASNPKDVAGLTGDY
jgi:WD40 repeat protein